MLNRVREWWEGLSRNNQIILAVTTVGCIVALGGFITWASTPEYVTLFSNLSAQDANAIADKLRESSVPYKMQHSGSAIDIPAQFRDEMAVKLVSAGLPHDPAASFGGYSTLQPNISMTSEMEKLKMKEALEGEVANMLSRMEQISAAIVRYAPADNSPFANTRHDASVAVIITPKPGQSLSDENVQAIIRLVQMAYTGMQEKGISVATSRGELLYDGAHAAENRGDDRLKLQDRLARSKRSELQHSLDQVLGIGKSVVMVNLELNDDIQQTKQTRYDDGVTTQTTEDTEKLDGRGQVGRNAPGANANLNPAGAAPGVPNYAATNDAGGQYNHETRTKIVTPGVTETTTDSRTPKISKLTVSAIVDSSVSLDQVTSITKTLQTAIAYSPNDLSNSRSVSVQQIAFDRSAELAAKQQSDAAQHNDMITKWLQILGPLALMAVCVILLARALRGRTRTTYGGGQLALPGGGTVSYSIDPEGKVILDSEGGLAGQTIGGLMSENGDVLGLPAGSSPKTFEVIEEAFDADLESILHLTKSKPETVAMLIRGWVTDDGP